jgi:hypothetical protein
MRQIFRSILILLILLALSLVAIQPFTYGKMPLTDDGTLHLYRVIALDYSLQHDNPIYPRYSSALAYGYGSPLFNYFSPFAYYLPRTLHVLGMSFVQAWLSSMIIYTWIAVIGAYLLGSKLSNMAGGFVTSVAYVYAPYMLYDAVSRGTITEYASLAILPFVLYAFTCLNQKRTRYNFGFAVISYAIFIPLHMIITLHGSILIVTYCLFLCVISIHKRSSFFSMILSGVCAIGLTSFFWFPALTETKYIKLNAITDNLPSLDVTNHLRPLNEILALPIAIDPRQLNAPIPITLSWVAIVLAIFAVCISYKLQDKVLRWQIWFWALVVLVVIFMNTPSSTWFWKNTPFLGYTQFAWRTLGIGSLALAVLSCLFTLWVISQITSKTAQNAIIAFFIVLMPTYAFSWTYRPYIELKANSVFDAHDYERSSGEVSLSSYSEYLPIWNESSLDSLKLMEKWQTNIPINRFFKDENPNIKILNSRWTGNSAELVVVSDDTQPLTLSWTYVIGWRAKVDGIETDVYPSQPEGLVSLQVPSGTRQIEIYLDMSPNQQFSQLVTIFSLFLFVMANVFIKSSEQETRTGRWLPTATMLTLAGIAIILFLTKNLLVNQTNNPFHYQFFLNDWANDTIQKGLKNFNNDVELIGHKIPETVLSGQNLELMLFWKLKAGEIKSNYQTKYVLKDSRGIIVKEYNNYQIGNTNTSDWKPNLYIAQKVLLPIEQTLPPLTYSLEVRLFNVDTLVNASLINEVGNPEANSSLVGYVTIESDSKLNQPEFSYETYYPLRFINISSIPQKMMSGEVFRVEWVWEATQNLQKNYQISLAWFQGELKLHEEKPVNLVYNFSTLDWKTGEMWKGIYNFIVPPSLPIGTYQIKLQLIEESNFLEHYPVGIAEIDTPIRDFLSPNPKNVTNEKWQNGLYLLGFDNSSNQLKLYWKTERQIFENLHWFAHLVDSNGKIVAQIDEIPVNWTRPTTSWATGEYVTTEFNFEGVTSGKYVVRIGWYEPQLNQRIQLEGGLDNYLLPIEIVVK